MAGENRYTWWHHGLCWENSHIHDDGITCSDPIIAEKFSVCLKNWDAPAAWWFVRGWKTTRYWGSCHNLRPWNPVLDQPWFNHPIILVWDFFDQFSIQRPWGGPPVMETMETLNRGWLFCASDVTMLYLSQGTAGAWQVHWSEVQAMSSRRVSSWSWGVPQNRWMVYHGKFRMDDLGGTPQFRKPLYLYLYLSETPQFRHPSVWEDANGWCTGA